MERFRVVFEKRDALRYTSHLDLQKVWMRVLYRAQLPLAYTQGFHPVPKLGYAWPLPLGWATGGELIDIWLEEPNGKEWSEEAFLERLNGAMPPGLRALSAEKMHIYGDSLTTVILSADYRVEFLAGTDLADLKERAAALMARDQIERERRGKMYDLRPLIESFTITEENGVPVMYLRMAARDSAMGRPDELVSALGYDPFTVLFERMGYVLMR